jgi:hypothetical protein
MSESVYGTVLNAKVQLFGMGALGNVRMQHSEVTMSGISALFDSELVSCVVTLTDRTARVLRCKLQGCYIEGDPSESFVDCRLDDCTVTPIADVELA